jgi:hypothetical protein
MSRFVTWSAIIVVTIALVFCGMYWSQMVKVRENITSQSDEGYILMILKQKGADDCVLTPISEGVWACKEWKSGKVFMVRR